MNACQDRFFRISRGHGRADQINFLEQGFYIARYRAIGIRNRRITAAIVAQTMAKGDMDIQGKRLFTFGGRL